MENYIDSEQHWEDSINADTNYKNDMEKDMEQQISKQINGQSLPIDIVSCSLPTHEQIQEWVCNEFNITGLDFDENVKTQYGYLPEYFKKFADWLVSNDR